MEQCMSTPHDKPDSPLGKAKSPGQSERRSFLQRLAGWSMLGGLIGGYGAFATVAGRYLMPARPPRRRWLFVAHTNDIAPGQSMTFRMPDGARVAIARRGSKSNVEDFLALSSTCPHLGCQVHWETKNSRFFCPCHNGAFDPNGVAIAGPPKEGGQSLESFPLRVSKNLLYVEAIVERGMAEEIAMEVRTSPPGPGHDPCLFERPNETI